VGRSNNPVGRKQVLLQLNEQHGHVLAIEFDDESVVASLMDLRPQVEVRISERTFLEGGVDGLVRQLLDCAARLIDQASQKGMSIIGIGIADPGLVNSRDGIVMTCSTISFWKNVHLRRIFEQKFSLPTTVDSKTRARAVAERVLGAGRMVPDMLYIDYGAGIGAGLILEGKVLRGHGWSAGEFGHTHVVEDGPPCQCGSFGCLEAMAGASAIEARIRKAISEGVRSTVLDMAQGDPEKITVWNVLTAAQQGDKACLAITEHLASYLGLGLANLVNLFNPSAIVLDQRLGLAGENLLPQTLRVIKRQALTDATSDLTVDYGKLGPDAGILGISLIVLENYFEIPGLKLPKFMIEKSEYADSTLELTEQLGAS
jgi:predicted NBD/HSP70 family sugar kinase